MQRIKKSSSIRAALGALLIAALTPFGGAASARTTKRSMAFGNPPAAIVGQWTKLNGADGTVSTLLLVDSTSLLAATNGSVPGTPGGVFITSIGGLNFTPVRNLNGLTNHAVRAIAVNQGLLFAGTGAGPGGGIFRCSVGSGLWSPVNSGLVRQVTSANLNPPSVRAFAVTSGGVLAGTNLGGVFRSQDSTTWGNNTLPDRTIFTFFIGGSGSFVLAGTDRGLFRSIDNGLNWTVNQLSDRAVLAFATSGTAIFAGTDAGLFRSTDGGMNWVLFDNLPSPRQPVTALILAGRNQLFAGTNTGLFRSTDGGVTWQACAGLPNPVVTSLAAVGNLLFVGATNGVFKGTGFIN